MKTIITISILFIAQSLRANDSSARYHMDKAKNHAIISTACIGIGTYAAYNGAYNQDKTTLSFGYTLLAVSAFYSVSAVYHYNYASIEARLSTAGATLTVKF